MGFVAIVLIKGHSPTDAHPHGLHAKDDALALTSSKERKLRQDVDDLTAYLKARDILDAKRRAHGPAPPN